MKHYFLVCLMLFFLLPTAVFADWQTELRTKIERSSFPAWMLTQISEELAPFKEAGVTQQDIEETIKDTPSYTVMCQIKNGQFSHSTPTPEFDVRVVRLLESLKTLSEAIVLPDVTFIVYYDESFIKEGNKAPVLTWCKHRERGKGAVNFPDYDALTGNTDLLKEVELGINLYPWESKKNSAFWRGSLTGGYGDPDWRKPRKDHMRLPRVKLAQASMEFPELIDARLTPNSTMRIPSHVLKQTASYWVEDHSSVSAHLQYKYQILIDGHVSAFSRGYWQVFSNCLIFKHNSPWYQWFYCLLKPYEHYIPYEADASDLAEKIRWAIQNDKTAHQISKNANTVAQNNLRYSDVMLYVYLLLRECANLQRF